MPCCPQQMIGADVWELLRMVDLLDRGLPPRRGGAQDQTQSFVDALAIVTAEQNRMERSILNGTVDTGDEDEDDSEG